MKWSLPSEDTYFAPRMPERGWDIDHLEAALKHVRAWRVAIDGGAHVGTWSRRLAGCFRHVIAFEPALDAAQCLAENVAGLANVRMVPHALGDALGKGRIVDDLSRPGNTGARFVVPDRRGDLEITTIDHVVGGLNGVALEVDLIKLDLEGYEYYALLGARDTLARCRPVVILEEKHFGARYGLEPGAALKLLESLGAREVERARNDRIFAWPTA